MRIYLDIETLPSLAPDARELARQGVKCPGSYKKPESIAQWWETEGESAIEDAFRRQALDAASGELCAVGFASDDSEPVSLVRTSNESEGHFLRYALDEIQRLLDTATRTGPDGHDWPDEPYFVAHNATFDLGFIWRRCVVHGIRPGFLFPKPSAREGKDYGDTMTAWAGYKNTIGLDRLCRALGAPSPKADGMDGGQVFDLWQAGNHEAIRAYNMADVAAVRTCWWRLNFEEGAAFQAAAQAKREGGQ
jgi:hypothetical protein